LQRQAKSDKRHKSLLLSFSVGEGVGEKAVMSSAGRVRDNVGVYQRGRKTAMAQSFLEGEEIDACLQ
jgi:hypothetical protein